MLVVYSSSQYGFIHVATLRFLKFCFQFHLVTMLWSWPGQVKAQNHLYRVWKTSRFGLNYLFLSSQTLLGMSRLLLINVHILSVQIQPLAALLPGTPPSSSVFITTRSSSGLKYLFSLNKHGCILPRSLYENIQDCRRAKC